MSDIHGRSADGNAWHWAIVPLGYSIVHSMMMMMMTLNLRAQAGRGGGELQPTARVLDFVPMPLLGWGLGLPLFSLGPTRPSEFARSNDFAAVRPAASPR